MGCGASSSIGDSVMLRKSKLTDDCLGFGEVGKIVKISDAGPKQVKGPRGKLRWYEPSALQLAAPVELATSVGSFKWWLSKCSQRAQV